MSKTDQFTKVPVQSIPSNNFDLSHDVGLTMDAGYLVPLQCIEALPGDKFHYTNNLFARLAPMVTPPFGKMDITTLTAFVPLRLIWPNSQKFFTHPVPDDETPVPPFFNNVIPTVGSLAEYLGLPTNDVYSEATGGIRQQFATGAGLDGISALPFAAYQKFFNDWCRDENLYNLGQEIPFELLDGLNNYSTYSQLRRRAWRHDYFTSALPFAQKGEAVEIPIGSFTDLPIEYRGDGMTTGNFRRADGSIIPPGTGNAQLTNVGVSSDAASIHGVGVGVGLNWDPKGTLWAPTSELTDIAAVTVNTLRWATKLQEFLEKNARGGTRYTEIVRQHFGVRSSDARLQRAEFLGFSTTPITISEVLQTGASQQDTTPLGEMGGHGIAFGNAKPVHYFAEEHGFFITMASIRPRTQYFQGLSKMWTRKSPLDYAWPTFAQLGEQEVLNKEVYFQGRFEQDNEVFGYVPRYAEYRYQSDRIAGEFRTSLAHWHTARIFDSAPALNENFISCTPTERFFAVNAAGVHNYYLNVSHKLSVRRMLPKYAIPSL